MKHVAIALALFFGISVSPAGNPATPHVAAAGWQLVGLAADTVFQIYVGQNSTFLAGLMTKGVWRSSDNGVTWNPTTGLPNARINDIKSIAGTIWAATEMAGLYKSTDDGLTWAKLTLPQPIPSTVSVRRIVANQHGEMLVTVFDVPSDEGYGVGRSTDGGATWIPSSGLTEGNITDIISTASGAMYCGVKGSNGLFKSTDFGATWNVTGMTKSYRVSSLGCGVDGTLYGATSTDSSVPISDGIYRSTDNGATWSPVNNGVPSPAAFQPSGTFVFGTDGSVLIGSINAGVLRSTNGGASWSTFNDGLTVPIVAQMTVGPTGNIYACGLGVWTTTSATGVADQASLNPTEFALNQNYPNPFNPSTVISFSLPVRSRVKLTVYNALGQEMAQLRNGVMEAGVRNVTFNANGLPTGMYFYKLEARALDAASNFVSTRKLLLVK